MTKYIVWSKRERKWYAPDFVHFTSLTHAAGRFNFIPFEPNDDEVYLEAPPQSEVDQDFFNAARGCFVAHPSEDA